MRPPPRKSRSIEFFEKQFQRQVKDAEYGFNPFETLALGYLKGTVLDLGCGLGNLGLEAARRGCIVTAVDGSPTAVERIRLAAARESLSVLPILADLDSYHIGKNYDTIVAIGVLMFFRKERALTLLEEIREWVNPSGRAVVNVLVEGTTFLEMFDPGRYYLFGRDQIQESFGDWEILECRCESFPAPGGTVKEFTTVVAERPAAAT